MAPTKIQEERMKRYFVQAAKEILRSEGLEAASTRNIAERAGYSYATLYNYFKDSRELILECIKDFYRELEDFVTGRVKTVEQGKNRIKEIAKAYCLYFIQYPGIFELFFLERASVPSSGDDSSALIFYSLDRLCTEDWQKLEEKSSGTPVKTKQHTLRYTMTGILLFYIRKIHPPDFESFLHIIESQLDSILDN